MLGPFEGHDGVYPMPVSYSQFLLENSGFMVCGYFPMNPAFMFVWQSLCVYAPLHYL